MQAPVIAFSTPREANPWRRWLLLSPLARIAWFTAILYVFMRGAFMGFQLLHWTGPDASSLQRAIAQVGVELVPVLVAYLVLVHWLERRRVLELAPRALLPKGGAGLAAGVALFSVVVGVLWLLGVYHVVRFDPRADWIPEVIVTGLCAGLAEEIVTRGVLYRIVEEGLGTWVALLVSAAFFGFAHINNPGATWWSSAAIAIEAGLLLAMLYNVTRSLWPCVGLHAGWNIAQGTLYGIPVSGTTADGFLVSTRTGPDWLSGGSFGAEASVVALAVCSACTVGLLVMALRRGTIVGPSWTRRMPPGVAGIAVVPEPR